MRPCASQQTTWSPPIPITRLTNFADSSGLSCQSGGPVNTTTDPRRTWTRLSATVAANRFPRITWSSSQQRVHDSRAVKLAKERRQRDVGGVDRLWPVEPRDVLALFGRRARVTVCPQEEAHVEVLVTVGRRVHVDVDRVIDARRRR